jgi:hypothetical protein
MFRFNETILAFILLSGSSNYISAQEQVFSPEALKEDFLQFRQILEENHCCLYEYTPKTSMDSLFDNHYQQIDHDMTRDAFFRLLSHITAQVGCMHTATWMPGRFYVTKPRRMFPLIVTKVDGLLVVSGSYNNDMEVPRGSILLDINGTPVEEIVRQIDRTISADALNPHFIRSQTIKRFSLRYACNYGLPDQYKIKYLEPGQDQPLEKILTPADHESLHKVVFSHFSSPPLGFKIVKEKNTAILTVPTFIYYDKVDYFTHFMDSCFRLIDSCRIRNLILDVRGNGGGDPFCSSVLFAYLQKDPSPYFAEAYGKYAVLADPLPISAHHFTGNLFTLVDGSCGSTNGHFCALLKYHGLGTFIGTPSGATYKCNAGKNTEFRLGHTQMILTIGRSTYAAAVQNMDKSAPIMPDVYVHETYKDFLECKDVAMDAAFHAINNWESN